MKIDYLILIFFLVFFYSETGGGGGRRGGKPKGTFAKGKGHGHGGGRGHVGGRDDEQGGAGIDNDFQTRTHIHMQLGGRGEIRCIIRILGLSSQLLGV